VSVAPTPLPVTVAGTIAAGPAPACASPSPGPTYADPVCQTAADAHRLVSFSVPALSIGLFALFALLVLAFGLGARRRVG
jgi:hypothetical protein